jgi:hypothetical protein
LIGDKTTKNPPMRAIEKAQSTNVQSTQDKQRAQHKSKKGGRKWHVKAWQARHFFSKSAPAPHCVMSAPRVATRRASNPPA